MKKLNPHLGSKLVNLLNNRLPCFSVKPLTHSTPIFISQSISVIYGTAFDDNKSNTFTSTTNVIVRKWLRWSSHSIALASSHGCHYKFVLQVKGMELLKCNRRGTFFAHDKGSRIFILNSWSETMSET